ncbi:MAG: FAD/NAD(P)-binding oxidoreductase [Ktedonobacteraceae bacterium]
MRQEKADSLVPVHNKVSKPHVDSADILIIGNGIAGLTAAIEARNLAPDVRIVMITDQNHPTINTPALKQFAIGKLTREQLLAYPPGTERTQGIHLIHGHVEEINAQEKFISLAGGRGFGYGTLLIATGSAPNSLPAKLPGRDFDGVITLHRLRDYLNLRRRLGEVKEAVVIGGGSHAIETVMGLLHWGIHVHWFIRSQTFLPRMLDETASTLVLERVQQAGATIYTGTEAIGIVGRVGSVAGVVTTQQQFIPCQLVAACTGTKAVTTLAEHCSVPMKHKNGILVDERLRSSVRDIYVAGDAAALKNPLTGEYEPRAQWYAAVLQGRMAGAMMTGHREQVKQTFGVPWHATQLGAFSMLMVGNPLDTAAGVTPLTGSSRGGYRRMTLLDDRLVGYLSLGTVQPDSLAIKRIIDEGLPVGDITRELLRGDFDARRYFSRQHRHQARGMVTTGRLPDSDPAPAFSSGRPAVTRHLSDASAGVRQAPAFSSGRPTVARPTTEVLPSPFASPAASAPARQTAPLPEPEGRRSHEQPFIYEYEAEEINPFAGDLPSLAPEVVESTLEAFPDQKPRTASGSLWTYSDQKPAAKVRQPARNLWSYDEPKGRGR